MPPEKKTFQNDLQDDAINEIAQKIKPLKPQTLSDVLKSLPKEPQKPINDIPVTTPQTIGTVRPLRTYQSDVAEAVQSKKESVVSISIAEKKRAENRGEGYTTEKTGSNLLVISLVCLLLLSGGAFAIYATYIKTSESDKVIVIPKPISIIGTNKDADLILADSSNTNFQETIRNEVDTMGLSVGTLGNIRIVEKADATEQIPVQKFVDNLNTSAPGGLTRSLENFMVGAYGKETGAETFLLLKTSSFEQAFGGMLSWEKTLALDLRGIFGEQTGIFQDAFIKNRDVRAIKDTSGAIKLLYSFLDSETFVIAGSEQAFITVLNQFNTSRVIR